MSGLGQDVITIGSGRVGQRYVLGAQVPLDNPNWRGPWDCAEFVSWAVYQAYGIIFGAGNARKVAQAEPYSGYWYDEAQRHGTVIAWQDALSIPGAVLIRRPTSRVIGHVAFSMGDGQRTLEARGAAYGVNIFDGAKKRSWGIGCLLPGVDYNEDSPRPPPSEPEPMPPDYLWLRRPEIKGAQVVRLQRALLDHGIHPGPVDGEFGPMTSSAVISFQAETGVEVDGVVGPQTADKLGLPFPIVPTDADLKIYKALHGPQGPANVDLPPPPAAFDGVAAITRRGNTFSAKTGKGTTFIIGSQTSYTDDMDRQGLFQGAAAIKDSLQFGSYDAADHQDLGKWAYFIEPTLKAEGGGRYATINTYDRAAFTFGAPQLAAHTPGKNFIEYLRELLKLADAQQHFPELSLRDNGSGRTTVHLKKGGRFEDLEQVASVTRPNGVKEDQLARLMSYLNPSPTQIDDGELSAAARLMNWLRINPQTKKLQIQVFQKIMDGNLQTAKRKKIGFTGKESWRVSLWVMDILHQGRGTYRDIGAALASGSPEASLKAIGQRNYGERIKTVAAAVQDLDKRGVLQGFIV